MKESTERAFKVKQDGSKDANPMAEKRTVRGGISMDSRACVLIVVMSNI